MDVAYVRRGGKDLFVGRWRDLSVDSLPSSSSSEQSSWIMPLASSFSAICATRTTTSAIRSVCPRSLSSFPTKKGQVKEKAEQDTRLTAPTNKNTKSWTQMTTRRSMTRHSSVGLFLLWWLSVCSTSMGFLIQPSSPPPLRTTIPTSTTTTRMVPPTTVRTATTPCVTLRQSTTHSHSDDTALSSSSSSSSFGWNQLPRRAATAALATLVVVALVSTTPTPSWAANDLGATSSANAKITTGGASTAQYVVCRPFVVWLCCFLFGVSCHHSLTHTHSLFVFFLFTIRSGRTIAITRGVNLDGSNFQGQDLNGVAFQQSIVRDANFQNCKLVGASFFDATLDGSNFENAYVLLPVIVVE